MSLTYKISGRGEKGGPAGAMLIFTVTVELDGAPVPKPTKEDLSVTIDCPGTPPKPNIVGGTGGAYHVGFKPTEPGKYWIDFDWRGIRANEPFMLPIKDKLGKVPDHPYSGTTRSGGSATPAKTTPAPEAATKTATPARTSGVRTTPAKVAPKEPSAANCIADGPGLEAVVSDLEEGIFTITSRDAKDEKLGGGHKFEVNITEGPSEVEAHITDNGDGTYTVKYDPLDEGQYTINVRYNNQDIAGSPFKIEVEEGVVDGMLAELDVLFVLRGKDGNPVKVEGGLPYLKLNCTTEERDTVLTEADVGYYSLTYQTIPGRNFVDVQLDGGKSIEGFPLEFNLD